MHGDDGSKRGTHGGREDPAGILQTGGDGWAREVAIGPAASRFTHAFQQFDLVEGRLCVVAGALHHFHRYKSLISETQTGQQSHGQTMLRHCRSVMRRLNSVQSWDIGVINYRTLAFWEKNRQVGRKSVKHSELSNDAHCASHATVETHRSKRITVIMQDIREPVRTSEDVSAALYCHSVAVCPTDTGHRCLTASPTVYPTVIPPPTDRISQHSQTVEKWPQPSFRMTW